MRVILIILSTGAGVERKPFLEHHVQMLLTDAQIKSATLVPQAFSVARCSRRPMQVVALGGSPTAGLSYSVWKNAGWLYHGRFASLLGNVTVWNGAVPATSPWFTEACLAKRHPTVPDLVLLEFVVNTLNEDLASYERLIEMTSKQTAVIAVHTHLFRCGRRMKLKMPFSSEPSAQKIEDRMEAMALARGVPVVSLGRLASTMRGSGNFMRDCRHPNHIAHDWLAQLLVGVVKGHMQGSCPVHGRMWPKNMTRQCISHRDMWKLNVTGMRYKRYAPNKLGLVADLKEASMTIPGDFLREGRSALLLGLVHSHTFDEKASVAVNCGGGCECERRSLHLFTEQRMTVNRGHGFRVLRKSGVDCIFRLTSSTPVHTIVTSIVGHRQHVKGLALLDQLP